ncbi:hypothetical protein CARUB_v10007839mg, partial [Capsella rubella]
MWIYGTVSEQLLDTILKAKSKARDIWLTLEELFCDNKEARSLQCDNEPRTLEIGDKSITDYTHKLKSLSDLLANLDSPIFNRALVMHMLNGLSDKFDSIINVIQHQTPFPSFTKARSMLLMEEKRLEKQAKPAPQHSTNDQQQQHYNNNNSGRGSNNNKNRGRGRNNRGRGRKKWNNNQFAHSHFTPPVYYQSYTLYAAPSAPPGSYTSIGPHEAHYVQSHYPMPMIGTSPTFSALPQAFSTMTLQDPSGNPWVMDSGTTNHIATQP